MKWSTITWNPSRDFPSSRLFTEGDFALVMSSSTLFFIREILCFAHFEAKQEKSYYYIFSRSLRNVFQNMSWITRNEENFHDSYFNECSKLWKKWAKRWKIAAEGGMSDRWEEIFLSSASRLAPEQKIVLKFKYLWKILFLSVLTLRSFIERNFFHRKIWWKWKSRQVKNLKTWSENASNHFETKLNGEMETLR